MHLLINLWGKVYQRVNSRTKEDKEDFECLKLGCKGFVGVEISDTCSF